MRYEGTRDKLAPCHHRGSLLGEAATVSPGMAIAPDAVMGVAMEMGSVDAVAAAASVGAGVVAVDDEDDRVAMSGGYSVCGVAKGLSMQRTVRHD